MTMLFKNRSLKKGAISSTTAFFVTAVGIIFLLAYWMQQSSPTATPTNPRTACTQEAKLCPDGSTVGRTGPNCEFAQCPQQNIDTSDWKTYRNEKYGFEVKYPNDWKASVEYLIPRGTLNLTSPSTHAQPYCKKYGCPADITIEVLDFSSFSELEERDQHGDIYNRGSGQKAVINGYPAYIKGYVGDGTILTVYFAGNNKLYAVTFVGPNSLSTLSAINRQVLSTFTLTN